MPTSSTVWWRSTSRSPLASTCRSISPCLDHASSMWLKNGMPVSTLEAPVPSRFSWRTIWVSLVLRSIRLCRGSVGSVLRCPVIVLPPARPRCVPPPPRRGRRGLPRGDSSATCGPASASPAAEYSITLEPRHEVLGRERRGEARGAAGRQHVVRARHVVAHHLRRVPARGTPRPRGAPARAAPPGRAPAARGARARARWPARPPPRGSAVSTSAPWPASAAPRDVAARAARRAGGRARPRPRRAARATGVSSTARAIGSCSAWASRSAATKSASALSSATTTTSLGPATMSMPTSPKTCALGERDVDVAGADDLVDAADGLGPVGERGDRLGAADPVGLGHARRCARRPAPPGSASRRRRRRDQHDLAHARPPAPGPRSSARWTDRRRGRRARRRATRSSGRTSWPSREPWSSRMRQERGAPRGGSARCARPRSAATGRSPRPPRARPPRTRSGRTASSAAARPKPSKRAVQSSRARVAPCADGGDDLGDPRARSGATAEGGRSRARITPVDARAAGVEAPDHAAPRPARGAGPRAGPSRSVAISR